MEPVLRARAHPVAPRRYDWFSSPFSTLHFPSLTIRPTEVLVGFGNVRRPHVLGIPFEFLASPEGNRT